MKRDSSKITKQENQSRYWAFTIFSQELKTLEDVKRETSCFSRLKEYLICGLEVCPETERTHIQGFVVTQKRVRMTQLKKCHATAHFEQKYKHATLMDNKQYCSKGGIWYEEGNLPEEPGEMEKNRWKQARLAAETSRFDDIDDQIFIQHLGNLVKIASMKMKKPANLDGVCGLWFWGPSGTGKTTYVNNLYPDAYEKSHDKWWDGYQGQETVIIDDLGPDQDISTFLKLWGDFKPFRAEVKGGYQYIRPKRIIVTSNYAPDKIVRRVEDLEAVKRRYKVTIMTQRWEEPRAPFKEIKPSE
jgi:hypothetical protein